MSKKDILFKITDVQQGFFTYQQAIHAGYPSSHHHLKIKTGEWERTERGIYRLSHYPIAERQELIIWSLWSRNKSDIPEGIWSHQTALDIHELSDVMPSKMHLSVPPTFKRKVFPNVLVFHYQNLKAEEIEQRRGYRVTTPLKTIVDVMTESKLSEELITQAIKDAWQKGKITLAQLEKAIDYPKELVYKILALRNFI